jgi:membrane protease YdiL (CAAX protease family)
MSTDSSEHHLAKHRDTGDEAAGTGGYRTAALTEHARKQGKKPYGMWPWGPPGGIIMTVLSFLAAQVIVGIVLGLVLVMIGWTDKEINTWFDTTLGQFVLVLCAESIMMGVLWWFLKRRRAGWKILGYQRKPVLKDAGMAIGYFVIYFALLIATSVIAKSLFNVDLDQKQELGFDNVLGVDQKVLVFISLVILPPIVEETIFRGFLFTGLRKKLPYVSAVIFTSLLFAAPHLMASSHGPLWIAGIDTFVMSLVLCYVREKSGALWAPIGIHFLKNGLAFLALYVFVAQ